MILDFRERKEKRWRDGGRREFPILIPMCMDTKLFHPKRGWSISGFSLSRRSLTPLPSHPTLQRRVPGGFARVKGHIFLPVKRHHLPLENVSQSFPASSVTMAMTEERRRHRNNYANSLVPGADSSQRIG
ncbi:hypothetical protein CDAR_495771 [Caerostris darwini]|uniref:Uncharacterized protein n=1 Tax=Caerostris darwini TaxID=1538125 RepID=A0AAV4RBQ0_9ARAC|nr:hypothetical protein CDAR_495771 [Caerostris darwini]